MPTIVNCHKCNSRQSTYDVLDLDDGNDYCIMCIQKLANMGLQKEKRG